MRIWIMNHYATNQFTARAGRHYWFARELHRRGEETTVFCANTFLDNEDEIDTGRHILRVKYAEGVPFVFVKTSVSTGNGVDRVKNMGLFFRNLFPATKRYAAKYGKPDLIIASSVHPLTMVAGIKIAKKMHIPCICEVRDLWPEAIFQFGKSKETSPLGQALIAGEHWIYRNASALIFTKEGDTDYLKERRWTTEQGGDVDLNKCYYINNGIDLKDFDQRIKKNPLKDEDLNGCTFNVTYTGTIRPVNHVGNLLDTAKIIDKHAGYEDVRFLVYGDGVELPKLRERVIKEQISNVLLKGFVERRYIPYILSKSSVNLLNYAQSQYNWKRGNSSNKLFEYMASGKPIISTVHMGYSIIKRYECGTELDEDTPQALAREIMRFHDMEKTEYERVGKNARIGAADFDFQKQTDSLQTVINIVMGKTA